MGMSRRPGRLEIERRCAAVDAGTMTTSDWEDVRARIERDI